MSLVTRQFATLLRGEIADTLAYGPPAAPDGDGTPLADADRVDEIARMLSGDRLTDAARAAARELLKV